MEYIGRINACIVTDDALLTKCSKDDAGLKRSVGEFADFDYRCLWNVRDKVM